MVGAAAGAAAVDDDGSETPTTTSSFVVLLLWPPGEASAPPPPSPPPGRLDAGMIYAPGLLSKRAWSRDGSERERQREIKIKDQFVNV